MNTQIHFENFQSLCKIDSSKTKLNFFFSKLISNWRIQCNLFIHNSSKLRFFFLFFLINRRFSWSQSSDAGIIDRLFSNRPLTPSQSTDFHPWIPITDRLSSCQPSEPPRVNQRYLVKPRLLLDDYHASSSSSSSSKLRRVVQIVLQAKVKMISSRISRGELLWGRAAMLGLEREMVYRFFLEDWIFRSTTRVSAARWKELILGRGDVRKPSDIDRCVIYFVRTGTFQQSFIFVRAII